MIATSVGAGLVTNFVNVWRWHKPDFHYDPPYFVSSVAGHLLWPEVVTIDGGERPLGICHVRSRPTKSRNALNFLFVRLVLTSDR